MVLIADRHVDALKPQAAGCQPDIYTHPSNIRLMPACRSEDTLHVMDRIPAFRQRTFDDGIGPTEIVLGHMCI